MDNARDGDDGNAFAPRLEEVGLVVDAEVVSAGAHGLQDRGRVGRGVDVDVQPLFVEVPLPHRFVDPCVIGVWIPIERQGDAHPFRFIVPTRDYKGHHCAQKYGQQGFLLHCLETSVRATCACYATPADDIHAAHSVI